MPADLPRVGTPAPIDICVLGPSTLRVGGHPVPLPGRRVPALLASLAARSPRPVHVDVLVEELYGDAVPVDPLNGVQIHISSLRRLLASAGADPSVIVTTSNGYRLVVEANAIDTHRLEVAVRAGRTALDHGTALKDAAALLDRVVPPVGAEPLVDVERGDGLEGERQRLRELVIAGSVIRAELHLATGRVDEATAHLRQLVAEEPLREQVHELLAVALYRAGSQADALRVLSDLRRVLRDELGIEPGKAVRTLEEQILHQDPTLAGSFSPTPRATRSKPTTLPEPRTSLIGREREVGLAAEMIREHQIVSVIGPPGVGKSRVALAAVRASGRTTWYVDVAGCIDDETLARALASAFHVVDAERGLADTIDAIAAADLDGVVLLDTCEHLVEAVAVACDRLTRSSPLLTVLATSRCALDVDGEQRVALQPLPPDDAVGLFVDRARSIDATLTLDAEVEPDIRAVCAALDGLPLAVELAAGRIGLLGVAGIRAHLDDRLTLFRSNARNVTPRLSSLEAAVAWTWDLLTPATRDALARLSVVPLALPLDLAAGTAAGAEDTTAAALDVLDDLVEHSAVIALGDGRVRVLDTIRAFALVHGPATVTAEATVAVTSWLDDFTESIQDALSSRPHDALGRLRRDAPLVRYAIDAAFTSCDRIAVRACSRLAWFWPTVGSHVDGRRWVELALSSPTTTPTERIALLVGAGVLAAAHGEHRAGWGKLASAVISADALGFDSLSTFAAAHHASMEWALTSHAHSMSHERWPAAFAALLAVRRRCDDGAPKEALSTLEALSRTVAALDDGVLTAMATDVRGRCLLAVGDADSALAAATSAFDAFGAHEFPLGEACASLTVGGAHLARREMSEGMRAARRAIDGYRRLGMTSTAERLEQTFADLARVAAPA